MARKKAEPEGPGLQADHPSVAGTSAPEAEGQSQALDTGRPETAEGSPEPQARSADYWALNGAAKFHNKVGG